MCGLGLIAATLLTGCSYLSPTTSAPTPPSPLPCDDSAAPAGAPGDQEIVFVQSGAVDGWPEFGTADITVVYADGHTATFEEAPPNSSAAHPGQRMAPHFSGEQPGVFRAGYLSGCAMEGLLSMASEAFADPDRDFGDPMISDSGSETVSFRAPGTSEIVTYSMYAFGNETTDTGAPLEGMSARELSARYEILAIYQFLEANNVAGDLLPADRLEVRGDEVSYDWPGPALADVVDPDSGCGELTGADAAAVFEFLAQDGAPTPHDGEDPLVRTLPPLMPACGPLT